jgi:hypothetical protein
MQIRSTWITGSSAVAGKKGNRVASLALTVTASLLLLTVPAFSAQKPATQSTNATTPGAGPASSVGVWTAPLNVGVVAIHAALLNTGKVLMWYYPSSVGANPPAVVFDPTTNTTTSVNIPTTNDFFCAGLTIGPDGNVFVIGGLNGIPPAPDLGITAAEIFNPSTQTWTAAKPMANARWYPTAVEFPDGTLWALSGTNASGTAIVQPMEQWKPATGIWKSLPKSANMAPTSQTYPRVNILTDGTLIMSGTGSITRKFDPTTNIWTTLGNLNYGNRIYGGVVLLPGLTKILTAGGHDTSTGPATNTAEILDLTQPTPAWAYTGSMTFPRYNANLVLLADGTVLMVGGNQVMKYGSPVEAAELYNPSTGTWSVMASQVARRGYHSTAMLLPDGRVLSAGSDDFAKPDNSETVEIFSPPYLFNGPRPSITAAPATVKYGAALAITTPDAASITRVALIRPAAVTHANNFDQRYVDLSFTVGSGVINATAPPNSNYAPPGYYMLVVVNSSGVPSVMPFIRVTN